MKSLEPDAFAIRGKGVLAFLFLNKIQVRAQPLLSGNHLGANTG